MCLILQLTFNIVRDFTYCIDKQRCHFSLIAYYQRVYFKCFTTSRKKRFTTTCKVDYTGVTQLKLQK